MDFYGRVEELCEKKGCAITSVAAALGMSKSAPGNWREGAIPRPSTVKRIAEYFGVTSEYLLNGITVESGNDVDIHDNHGCFIGDANAPVNFNANQELSDQEEELLNIFRNLSVLNRARLLIYANDMLDK